MSIAFTALARKTSRGSFSALLAASLTLTACAGGQQLRAEFVENDADDVCAANREGLVRSQEYFDETLVKGAVAGAIIGGVIGALTSENRARGALIGAGVGGLSGLAAGYLKAKADQAENRDQLRQSIYGDAAADGSRLSDLQRSITELNQCRARQIDEIRTAFQSRSITGDEARARSAVVRAAIGRDADLIGEILDDADERNVVYRQSVARVDNVDEDVVRGRAKTYEPRIVQRSRTSSGLPEVSSRSRPRGFNDVAVSEVALKDTKSLSVAQSIALEEDLADLDVILA